MKMLVKPDLSMNSSFSQGLEQEISHFQMDVLVEFFVFNFEKPIRSVLPAILVMFL